MRREWKMSLSSPVLTGSGSGPTVEFGCGSTAEVKIAGEQSSGKWAVVEYPIAGDKASLGSRLGGRVLWYGTADA
jgi:hypothetical protein